jgi:hypothetical protein
MVYLEEKLEDLKNKYTKLPDLIVSTKVEIDVKTKYMRVSLHIQLYGDEHISQRFNCPGTPSVADAENFIKEFNEILSLIRDYIDTPFQNLPLLLPVKKELIQSRTLARIISRRLRSGI